MKIKRYKKVKKCMGFYVNNYKFFKPYQILIDGTFCVEALENKFNIQDQMSKYLQAEVKLLTTQCVIEETEELAQVAHKLHGAAMIVKQFRIHQCKHNGNPVPGQECLRSMIGDKNESRYIIATQDTELQDQLTKVPGTPVIYLHGTTPVLKPPSQISRQYAEEMRKGVTSNFDLEKVQKMKLEANLISPEIVKLKKKKKKGPNPLSVLKKKKKTSTDQTNSNVVKSNETGKVRKRNRKRVKLPAHVKEALRAGI